ncbi:growth arrest and DNA damage-inducible proteins-interacting protein 1 [Scaptodrosophila lebanonensis]|uniref:Large ribosomal subunit protein mL64 n=1 Tax=Drosophila lebanonensis TaxID=7225 RepID=A0A6J2U754_DROLE|nr:growth arrest and DNA damage-inducible proteins-interacting protein 1 [Scaptodrosophila lebanonensis]
MNLKKYNVGALKYVRPKFISTLSGNVLFSPSIPNEIIADADTTRFDKSGLRRDHRNVLSKAVPYKTPHTWIHATEKYQRKLYGLYGNNSNVDPKICFDSVIDRAKLDKLDRIAQPYNLQQLREIVNTQEANKLELIKARENGLRIKLNKLEQWKSELTTKIAKREAAAQEAKERKERMVEEVRRHFGFKVDPRDERFKEMLQLKEKEGKRKDKEAKRKAKEDMMVAKLVEKMP